MATEKMASKRQLWALFCATKRDHRSDGLTAAQASQLLSELNDGRTNWTDKKVLSVIDEARQAGANAARLRLSELQSAGPAYAVVDELSGRIDGTLLDVCGGCWLSLRAAGKFYLTARRLSENRLYRFHCCLRYHGGGSLSIFDMSNRQEVSVNRAAYTAAAAVLKNYGIETTVREYID